MITPIKEDVVTYCRIILDNYDKYAIVDVESTGFDKNEVIDLAVIDPAGAVLYNGLFKPRYPVESGAEAIHHISMAMLTDAPSFSSEWPKIYEAIKDRIVITYNAKFDAKCIAITAGIHKIALPDITYQCFMLKYADYYDMPPKPGKYNAPYQKLELACQQQGIDIGVQEHRALSDTLATLALMKRIADLGPATRKYSQTPEPWDTMIGLDEMLSKPRLQGQDNALSKLINTSDITNQSLPDLHRSDNSSGQRDAKQTKQTSLFSKETKPILGKCIKCGKEGCLKSPGGSIYCERCGHRKRKVYGVMKGIVVVYEECKISVEKFVKHPRLGIYVCPCIVTFEEKYCQESCHELAL